MQPPQLPTGYYNPQSNWNPENGEFQNGPVNYGNFPLQNIPGIPNSLIRPQKPTSKISPSTYNIRMDLRDILSSINNLQAVYDKLADETLEKDEWLYNAKIATEIKDKLQESQQRFFHSPNISKVISKLKSTGKRRQKLKLKKQEGKIYKETVLQNREKVHEKIDNWQESVLQKNRQWHREKEMKKEADSILSEVRRKKSENAKNLEIISALEKLRDIRKNIYRNDCTPLPDEDSSFEKTVINLKEMLANRAKDYAAEERALQVILESEQQETEVKRKENRREISQQKLNSHFSNYCASVFGDYDEYCRYPYIQNATLRTENIESFLRIRHEWDIWASTGDLERSSTIPMGWVHPTEPSSAVWKSALT